MTSQMLLSNSDLIDVIESSKSKLQMIEDKYHPQLSLYSADLLARMSRAVYDAIHQRIRENISKAEAKNGN